MVLQCDECGLLSQSTYANFGVSQKKHPGQTLCKRCACRKTGKLKRGKPLGPRKSQVPVASRHHSWKGGKFVASDGYVKVYLGPKVYRKEHFLVMEEYLGRRLLATEIVHHLDGDKTNNALENLILLANESEHRKVHNSLYRVSIQLIKDGVIEFDAETKRYRVKP